MEKKNFSQLHTISPNNKQLQYKQKYEKIQNVIVNLNMKLADLFEQKQNQLINIYTNQMIKAKQELNELKNDINEDQIKKRLIKKKQQLEKQKLNHLEISLFFSKKYQNFKLKLRKVIQDARGLQSQIQFLTKKINQISSLVKNKNYIQGKSNLKKDYFDYIENGIVFSKNKLSEEYKNPSIFLQKQTISPNQLRLSKSLKQQNSSVGQETLNQKTYVKYQSIKRNQSYTIQLTKTTKNIQKIKQALTSKTFKLTKFQKMFQQSVQLIKQRKKRKNKGFNNIKKYQRCLIGLSQESNHHKEQLNDFDKKSIIEYFFSKVQVKFYIYQILFKTMEQLQKQKNKFDKIDKIFD